MRQGSDTPMTIIRAWTAVVALTAVCACAKLDETQFDAVRRAGQGLRTATDLGVTEFRYRELVQACSVEASLVSQKADTELEKAIALKYTEVCRTYRDVLMVWDAKAHDTQRLGSEPLMGYVEILTPDFRRLIEAYTIPVKPALTLEEYQRHARESLTKAMAGEDLPGPPVSLQDQVDSNAAVNLIWAVAAAKLEKANERR